MKNPLPAILLAAGVPLLGLAAAPAARAQTADLVSAFKGLQLTAPDTTQPKPRLLVKGSYSLTNQGTKKAKGFTLGAYLSGAPTIFRSDGALRPDAFPIGVVIKADASGRPMLSLSVDGGINKLTGLKLAAGAGLTLPLPGGTRIGPDFPFNVKIRTDLLPPPVTAAFLKGKYLVIVADAEGLVPDSNRANNAAAVGPLP